MKIVTHNGVFHSDDIFAVATLHLKFGPEIDVARSRDPETIAAADVVVDVGMVYDEAAFRFDHHQGPPLRDNGIPYASFGLVWRRFGSELAGSSRAADIIDRKIAQPIDAADNSIDISQKSSVGLWPYTIHEMFQSFRPTWLEPDNFDAAFREAVAIAKHILEREIAHAKALVNARDIIVKTYADSADKRILILDKKYPFGDVMSELPLTLMIVFPGADGESWHAKVARDDDRSYASRADFPESWAGKRDNELADVTGVPDAVFCHRGRFLAVAKSREGAVRLAERALAS